MLRGGCRGDADGARQTERLPFRLRPARLLWSVERRAWIYNRFSSEQSEVDLLASGAILIRRNSKGAMRTWPRHSADIGSVVAILDDPMPYSDPEKRRAYDREYKRTSRSGGGPTPSQTVVPIPFRLKTAADVLALLEQQFRS